MIAIQIFVHKYLIPGLEHEDGKLKSMMRQLHAKAIQMVHWYRQDTIKHEVSSVEWTHSWTVTFAMTPALLYFAFSSSPLSTASFSITMAFLACWWCSALSNRFLTAALQYTGKDSVTQRASECISACADGFISVFRIPREESPPKKESRQRSHFISVSRIQP